MVLHDWLSGACVHLEHTLSHDTLSACYGATWADSNGRGRVEFGLTVPPGDYWVTAWESSPSTLTDYVFVGPQNSRVSSPAQLAPVSSGQVNSTKRLAFNFATMPLLGYADTTVSLATSPDPLVVGDIAQLHVTVTGGSGTPSGRVDVYDQFGFVGGATLSGGSAQIPYLVTHAADNLLYVEYRGSSTYYPVWSSFDPSFAPYAGVLEPGYGDVTGGTHVSLWGAALGNPVGATFDGVASASVTGVDERHVDLTTPSATSGYADVVLTTTEGQTNPVDFLFVDPDTQVLLDAPVRVVDFRAGLSQYRPYCFQIAGSAGVPLGAEAVIMNVTTSAPAAGGNVIVYPDYDGIYSSPPPSSSTVNFEVGRDVANSAVVALGDNGAVCAYVRGAKLGRLIFDVSGFILPDSGITTQTAQRVIDTRRTVPTTQLAGIATAGTTRTATIAGHAGVPANATAILANVTVTQVAGPGHLKIWPSDQPEPRTSVINYAPGADKANAQFISLSPSGQVKIKSVAANAHVIIDVVGYTVADSAFHSVEPTRILDTRPGGSRVGNIAALAPKTVYTFTIGDTVPDWATAIVVNVTAIQPNYNGNLRVYPATTPTGTTPPPNTSTLNYVPGRDIPNLAIITLQDYRRIHLYNHMDPTNGSVNLAIDLIGYIGTPPQP